MTAPTTLPGALAAAIIRVAEIREQYREAEDAAGLGSMLNVKPAISLMTASLDAAVSAVDSGDVVQMIRALQDLRGYSE